MSGDDGWYADDSPVRKFDGGATSSTTPQSSASVNKPIEEEVFDERRYEKELDESANQWDDLFERYDDCWKLYADLPDWAEATKRLGGVKSCRNLWVMQTMGVCEMIEAKDVKGRRNSISDAPFMLQRFLQEGADSDPVVCDTISGLGASQRAAPVASKFKFPLGSPTLSHCSDIGGIECSPKEITLNVPLATPEKTDRPPNKKVRREAK